MLLETLACTHIVQYPQFLSCQSTKNLLPQNAWNGNIIIETAQSWLHQSLQEVYGRTSQTGHLELHNHQLVLGKIKKEKLIIIKTFNGEDRKKKSFGH